MIILIVLGLGMFFDWLNQLSLEYYIKINHNNYNYGIAIIKSGNIF